MIQSAVSEQSSVLSDKFRNATPFKHLCIDNFLEVEAAESLLRDFPSFDPEKAKNEFGEAGRKPYGRISHRSAGSLKPSTNT